MNIRFKEYKTIENADQTNDSVLQSINELLKLRKTNTISILNNQIIFENTIWKFGSNLNSMSQVDKGSITLNRDTENNNLIYEFRIRILTDILLIVAFLIAGLLFDYFILLGSLGILIQLLVKINMIRNNGYQFLIEIEETLKRKSKNNASLQQKT